MFIDKATNDLYVADGYGNRGDRLRRRHRQVQAALGRLRTQARTPTWPLQSGCSDRPTFRNPVHCAELSNDGLLYICDRVNDRIQVFKPDGTFVKEMIIGKGRSRRLGVGHRLLEGSPAKYIFLADGSNEKVYIMLRDTLKS